MNNQLPEGWLEVEIGEIADIVGGGTPQSSDPTNFAPPNTAIAWLTPADLSGYKNKYIAHGSRDLTIKGYESSSAKLVPKGSVLFSSRAPIGYVAITDGMASTSQGFKSFVALYGISPDYLYYSLINVRDIAKSVSTGTTFKELSSSNAKKLPFKLISTAEQKEIANRLDIFFAQIDSLNLRLNAISNILEQFRQSVLDAAVNGLLTKGWRLNRSITLDSWRATKIANIVHSIETGKNLQCIERPPKSDECGIIKISAVTWGEFDENQSKTLPDEKGFIENRRIKIGDFLVSRANTIELLGNPVIVCNITKNLMLSDKVWRLVMNEKDKPWLNIFLKSTMGRKQIESRTMGNQLSMHNISQKAFLDIDLKDPLDEEKHEIIYQVEKLLGFSDRIKNYIYNIRKQINPMTQTILKKAFCGELTDKWREINRDLISEDNDAETLLERIKMTKKSMFQDNSLKMSGFERKQSKKMKRQEIISIVDTLKNSEKALSGQELFIAAGYPSDATTEQLEQFFLDIREQLDKTILRYRPDGYTQDWFELIKPSLES